MTVAAYAGIQHGLDALRKGGVAPKLLIIDDGWQSTELDEALRPISETGAARSENKVICIDLALLQGTCVKVSRRSHVCTNCCSVCQGPPSSYTL